jgi:hypothetical protein
LVLESEERLALEGEGCRSHKTLLTAIARRHSSSNDIRRGCVRISSADAMPTASKGAEGKEEDPPEAVHRSFLSLRSERMDCPGRFMAIREGTATFLGRWKRCRTAGTISSRRKTLPRPRPLPTFHSEKSKSLTEWRMPARDTAASREGWRRSSSWLDMVW